MLTESIIKEESLHAMPRKVQRPGISLRDDIAVRAMQGMLAHPTRYKPRTQDAHLHWHDAISKEAYEIADAMLALREHENE